MIEKVADLKISDADKFEDAMGMLGDITDEILECLGLDDKGNKSPEPVDQF